MMDTAKVDIRKLQLLNDRINQCIDALNQVRLSVHGLSHTAASPQVAGMPGFNPWSNPWTQNLSYGPGYTVVPQAGPIGVGSPFVPGLSHTTAAAGGLQVPIAGINPLSVLSHTSAEGLEAFQRPVFSDPFLVARIAQTFPYAYVSIPPVVTIY